MVRAKIATLIGLPLAACTLVSDACFLIWRYASGIPLLRRELLGHGLATLLSVAVVGIALRAWRRTRHLAGQSISPRITRRIPWLLAIGLAAGLLVGNAWAYGVVDLDRRLLTARCEELLPAGPHGDPVPAALAACIDAGIGCREAAAAELRESGAPAPDDPWSGDAWLACLKSRLPSVR